MRTLLLRVWLLLMTAGWLPGKAIETQDVTAGGKRYRVVRVDLQAARVEMFWKDRRGERFGSLGRVRRAVGVKLLAATNAGIYEPGYVPEGLHVEHGRVLRPLNQRAGRGNFYTQPSGVFYTDGSGAHILSTDSFAAQKPKALQATQSGPLLVRQNRLAGPLGRNKLYIRNGVGVLAAQKIVLVLSLDEVSLFEFAEFFRVTLQCPDALYLDGSISGLYALGTEFQEARWSLAGILGIVAQ